MAILLLCVSVASTGLHLYSLHFWCLLLMCRSGYLLLCWVLVCLFSLQLLCGLSSWNDCDRIAKLLCRDLVHARIIYMCCTGGYAALCIIAAVIGLQHLWQPLLPMVCSLLLHLLPLQNSSSGISPDHVVYQRPHILCCYTTAPHLISSCLWMQCCIVKSLISSAVHTVTYLHP